MIGIGIGGGIEIGVGMRIGTSICCTMFSTANPSPTLPFLSIGGDPLPSVASSVP